MITTEKKLYTKEEREAFLKKRQEFKDKIKKLATEQAANKKLLRSPHDGLPEQTRGKYGCRYSGRSLAGYLMYECSQRREEITKTLIEYKKFLGKPFEMHLPKKK